MKSLHPISNHAPPAHTLAFWRQVRWFIETIWALFGGPEMIADMRQLSRTDHRLLASWLCNAETYVRKILLIEAADVKIEERKFKVRKAVRREKTIRMFYADEPQNWRVSFRLCARGQCKSTRRVASGSTSLGLAAWPLAERFEALLRVFDAPEAYVKRAACALRRQPKLFDALAAPFSPAGLEDVFEPVRSMLLKARGALRQAEFPSRPQGGEAVSIADG